MPAPQAAPPPSVNLSVLDPVGGPGPFAIGNLEKLMLVLDASHYQPGRHAVRMDVTSPAGTLYAQLPAALLVGDNGVASATVALQVRGTAIASFRDTGNWQVVAYVDGDPVTSASVDFAE
jgi:hypothetical protein